MALLDEAIAYWKHRISEGFDRSSGGSRIRTLEEISKRVGNRDPEIYDLAEYMYYLVKVKGASRHSVWRFTWDIDTTPHLDYLPDYGASVLIPGVDWDIHMLIAEIDDVMSRASVSVWVCTPLSYDEIESARMNEYVDGVFKGHRLPKWASINVDAAVKRAERYGMGSSDHIFFIVNKDGVKAGVTRRTAAINKLRIKLGVDVPSRLRTAKSYHFLPRGGKYRYWNSKPGVAFGDGSITNVIGYVVEYRGEPVFVASTDGDALDIVDATGKHVATVSLDEISIVDVDAYMDVVREAYDNGVYLSHKLRKRLGVYSFGNRESRSGNQHKRSGDNT